MHSNPPFSGWQTKTHFSDINWRLGLSSALSSTTDRKLDFRIFIPKLTFGPKTHRIYIWIAFWRIVCLIQSEQWYAIHFTNERTLPPIEPSNSPNVNADKSRRRLHPITQTTIDRKLFGIRRAFLESRLWPTLWTCIINSHVVSKNDWPRFHCWRCYQLVTC